MEIFWKEFLKEIQIKKIRIGNSERITETIAAEISSTVPVELEKVLLNEALEEYLKTSQGNS